MNWSQALQNRPRIYNWLHSLRLAPALTQTNIAERDCLCRHVKNAEIAVEIGTYMGVTAAELVKALPEGGLLYCIDPYFNGASIRAVALRHLERQGVTKHLRLIESTLQNALLKLPPQVDFIFVDGDHSRKGLEADWVIVKQLLKPGGIAAFHDCKEVPGSAHTSSWEAIGYYDEVIARDAHFTHLESCSSLQVIQRNQEN